MRRTRTTRRPRKSRRTFMPRGFVARLNAGDPAARYMKLQMMADPTRGASPNEVKIANKQMVKLEERHGKRALQEKVAAIKAEEDRAAQARRGGGGGGRREEGRSGGPIQPNREQQDVAPQPSAPAGSGWHFRFFSSQERHPYVRNGHLYGFVSNAQLRVLRESDVGISDPREAVLMWTYNAYGIGHAEEDWIATWEAGTPEPGPTPAEQRRRDEEEYRDAEEEAYAEYSRRQGARTAEQRRRDERQQAESFARMERAEDEEAARRARMSPAQRLDAHIRDVIEGSFQDWERYVIWPGDNKQPVVTPEGREMTALLQKLRWDQVKQIEEWMHGMEQTVQRAIRTFYNRGVSRNSRKKLSAEQKARLSREYEVRAARARSGAFEPRSASLSRIIDELVRTSEKPKAKAKAQPKAQPKASTSRLDRFRQHPGWPDDIKVMKAYLAGAENPPR